MKKGQKHLISCRCFLPQFKSLDDPPFHKFLVFSIIDDDDNVITKYSQCNNCGVIHNVIDICTSKIVNKDELYTLNSIDDIKIGLNDKLVSTLERYEVDLATWENVDFIIQNENWGEIVKLTSDSIDKIEYVKCIRIMGKNIFKIETFEQGMYI